MDLGKLQKILTESAADIRRIVQQAYEAGLADGRDQERRDMAKRLGFAKDDETPTPKADQLPRGFYADAVRGALRTIAVNGHPVGVDEVLNFIQRGPRGETVTADHVRTALKVLHNQQEAKRVGRGQYTAGPALNGGDLVSLASMGGAPANH